MPQPIVLFTLPGLRVADLDGMPELTRRTRNHAQMRIEHSFPAVTWPSQATLLTGTTPDQHGVIANGFYWRDRHQVEMWTAGNEVIERPQIWDRLKSAGTGLTSAAWFPMLSKRCKADYVCMPAPVHNPDGSESLWCYTQPQELYGELMETLGHFPLQHFWGPLANIQSSEWIARSAEIAAARFQPDFFYIYLPHLDYAAQKFGPDSEPARAAVQQLDQLLGSTIDRMQSAYEQEVAFGIVSEYTISATNHVSYPNRVLREQGWLRVNSSDEGEQLDFQNSDAWALVDHQFSHVFVRDRDPKICRKIQDAFGEVPGIQLVLDRDAQTQLSIQHPRSGDLVLVSTPESWQAYYWWLRDDRAPGYAATVDIHRKPGYDPIELHFDKATRSIPLDATLAKGSHGAISPGPSDSLLLLPPPLGSADESLRDTLLFPRILGHFGIVP